MVPDIKKYKVLEEVGRGGMATVYKAWQQSLSRFVALKILPAYFAHDEALLLRFRHEALAVAKLRHPHIVQVYDFHQEGELYYLAMEFVAGGSMQDRLTEAGRLSIKSAIKFVRQVAEGLHHAHEKGFIHRDIKPSNILISEDDEAVITDFGIVKAIGETNLTKTVYGGMGTSEYMSPEQAKGERVRQTSDLYSLGVVFYEALTGMPPFNSESPMATMHSQIYEPPKKPSQLNSDIGDDVEKIILKLLSKDPAARFSSGLELVSVLNELTDKNIVSRPAVKPTLVRRDTRIAKRTPARSIASDPRSLRPAAPQDDELKKSSPSERSQLRGESLALIAISISLIAGLMGFFVGYFVIFKPPVKKIVSVKEVVAPSKKTEQKPKPDIEKEPELKRIAISPADATLAVGGSITLSVEGDLTDGSKKGLTDIVWRLSDHSLATIDADGKLIAKAPGVLEVEAAASGKKAVIKINLIIEPVPVVIDQPAPEPPRILPRRRRSTPKPPPVEPDGTKNIPIIIE